MDAEHMAMIEDTLRPQTTFDYKKQYASVPYEFPNLYITDPFPTMGWCPISTYADDQNTRFTMRYQKKSGP
jgi:hypothetical protein